jgi:quercetin dioxygenase-like cupin family protein
MRIVDTNKEPWAEKRPGWKGVIFSSDSMTFAHWRFAEGSTIHAHDHVQEEVWHVVEGELEVTVAGETRTVGPGAVLILAPNTQHQVTALSDGFAIVADYPLRPGF